MYHILLVDDEPIIKVALRRMLDKKNSEYAITGTASNGVEALRFIENNKVDLVITDLKMPQMDGLELIRRLAANAFPGVILVLSNYSDFDLVREALLNGAQDYMLKVNVNKQSLHAQLERVSQKLQASHALLTPQPNSDPVQTRHYRKALLSAYLLDKQEEDPGAMPPQDLLPQAPYWLYDIWVEEKPNVRPVSGKNIKGLLQSIFEDAGLTDVLTLKKNEYLCLVPCRMLEEREYAPTNKAEQIIRQMQMYLNRQVRVVFTEAAETLAAIREKYSLCERASQLLFYPLGPAMYHAEEAHPVPFPADREPGMDAEAFTHSFFTGGEEALASKVDSFLRDCTENQFSPREVCAHAYQVVQWLLLSNPLPENSRVFSRHAAMLECKDAHSLQALLLELLTALIHEATAKLARSDNKDVNAALLHIQYHYTEKLTLEGIAASVNLDKSYLCRLFKKKTGKSLFQYINELRMTIAAELILNGSGYLREVAAAVGIEDPFYFTRLFKKFHGVSPSEYKAGEEG